MVLHKTSSAISAMHINYSNSTYKTTARTKRVSDSSIFTLAVAIACAIYIFSTSSNSGSMQCKSCQTAITEQVISMNND